MAIPRLFIRQIILCRVNYVEASVNTFQSAYQKFELLSRTYSKSEMDGHEILWDFGHGRNSDMRVYPSLLKIYFIEPVSIFCCWPKICIFSI